MIVKQQIKEINRVRAQLQRLEHKASEDDGYGSGRFAEACRDADESLHNVLLTARYFVAGRHITDEELGGKT